MNGVFFPILEMTHDRIQASVLIVVLCIDTNRFTRSCFVGTIQPQITGYVIDVTILIKVCSYKAAPPPGGVFQGMGI